LNSKENCFHSFLWNTNMKLMLSKEEQNCINTKIIINDAILYLRTWIVYQETISIFNELGVTKTYLYEEFGPSY
jgi:hypothetical protein